MAESRGHSEVRMNYPPYPGPQVELIDASPLIPVSMVRRDLPQAYLSRKRSASPVMLSYSPNKRAYVPSPLAEGKGRGSPLGSMPSQPTADINEFLKKQKNLAHMKQNFEREKAVVDDSAQFLGSESSHTSRHGTPLRDVLSRNMMQQHLQWPPPTQYQGAKFSPSLPNGFNQISLNLAQDDTFTDALPHNTQYNQHSSYIGAVNGGSPLVQNTLGRYSVVPDAVHGQMNTGVHQSMDVRQNRLHQPPVFPVRPMDLQSGILHMDVQSNAYMPGRSYPFVNCDINNIEGGLPEISERQVVTRCPSPLATINGGLPRNMSHTNPMGTAEMDRVRFNQSPGQIGRNPLVVGPSARGRTLSPGTPRRAKSTTRESRGRTISAGPENQIMIVAPNVGGKRHKSKSKPPIGSSVPVKGHVPRIQIFSELGNTNFDSLVAERTDSVRLATSTEGVIQTDTQYHTPRPAHQGPAPATPADCINIDSDTPSTSGSLTMEELLRLRGKPKGKNKFESQAVQQPSTPRVANTAEIIDLLTPDASASHQDLIVSRSMRKKMAKLPRSDTKKSRARYQSRPCVAEGLQKTHEKAQEQENKENAARAAAREVTEREVTERQMNAEVAKLFGDDVDMTDVYPEITCQAERRKQALANDRDRREAQQQAAKKKRERKAQEDLEQEERAKRLREEHEARMKLRRQEERKKAAAREAITTEARREQAYANIKSNQLERQVLQAEMEDSLFITSNIPPSNSVAAIQQRSGIERLTLNNGYDVNMHTRKPIGSTATGFCALTQASKITGYCIERDAFEAEIVAQKTQKRLRSRYKRAKSNELEKNLQPNSGLSLRSQPNKDCFHAEVNIENSEDKDNLVSTALFPLQLRSGRPTAAAKPAKSTFSSPVKSLSARPIGSSAVHISDAERQKIEADQRRKEQEGEKARQKRKTEENDKRKAKLREERLAKEAAVRTCKARERKRLKIISEAEPQGIQLSAADIREQLDEFMEKREKELKKRKHKESLKQQNEDFAPDTLAIQWSFDSQHTQAASSHQLADFEDRESDDNETKVTKANARAVRAGLDATRQGRGHNFSRAAQMSVETEYDSNISEEDTDLIFTLAGSGVSEETGESEIGPASDSTELPDTTSTSNVYGRRRTTALPTIGENTVKIYYLMEKFAFNGLKGDGVMKNGYFKREESIRNAKILAEKYKAMPHKAYQENTTPDDLWEARVDFGLDSVEVFVLEGYKSTNEGPRKLEMPFDATRFDRKYYMVRQITTKASSEGTGATSTTYTDIVDLVADMSYANQVAADLMIDFLKPLQPHLDHTIQHSEEVAPTIRQVLKHCQEQGELLGVDLDMEDGGIPWMKEYTHIEFKVEEKIMKGPLN